MRLLKLLHLCHIVTPKQLGGCFLLRWNKIDILKVIQFYNFCAVFFMILLDAMHVS